MRYMGGKSRLARRITDVILSTVPNRSAYLEPFIGGAAMFGELAPHFDIAIASDLQPDIVALWQAVIHDGYRPPTTLSHDEWKRLRDEPPSALRGFAAFGCSFGGKMFGGYARGGFNSDNSPRNYQAESARSIEATAARVDPNRARVFHCSYDYWQPLAGDVVYCDPPYFNTGGYKTGDFDTAAFWVTVEQWRQAGAHVFVSEYTAPPEFPEVWAAPHRSNLGLGILGRLASTERLFYREP